MKLYKYFSEAVALEFIKNTKLRITQPFFLNDPFECPKLTNNYLKKITCSEGDALVTKIITDFGIDNFGIISLTTSNKNILMWSHYASEHRGMVVEFDIDDGNPYGLFEVDDEIDFDSNHPFNFDKVDYIINRTMIPNTMNNLYDINYSLKILKEIFYTKSKDWKYEREWRFMVPGTLASFYKLRDEKEHGTEGSPHKSAIA